MMRTAVTTIVIIIAIMVIMSIRAAFKKGNSNNIDCNDGNKNNN